MTTTRNAITALTVSQIEVPEDTDEALFYANYPWREDCTLCEANVFRQPAVEIEDEEMTICMGCFLINFIVAPASLLTETPPGKHVLQVPPYPTP